MKFVSVCTVKSSFVACSAFLTFGVNDSCSDGLISYDELLSYFQSANSQLRERFTHMFAEHTFISSPVCEHCKGMVSEGTSVSAGGGSEVVRGLGDQCECWRGFRSGEGARGPA